MIKKLAVMALAIASTAADPDWYPAYCQNFKKMEGKAVEISRKLNDMTMEFSFPEDHPEWQEILRSSGADDKCLVATKYYESIHQSTVKDCSKVERAFASATEVRETACGRRLGSELTFDETLDVLRAVVGAVGSCGIAARSSGDVRKSVNQECGFFQDGWGAAGEKDEL